jgi:hypothetical protein
LQEKFPGELPRIAAGIAGRGSECFGFDDEVSQDHDWGTGISFWLTEQDEREFGFKLERFAFEGREAIIVYPEKAREGCPWLLKTEYWDAYPDVEIRLVPAWETRGEITLFYEGGKYLDLHWKALPEGKSGS